MQVTGKNPPASELQSVDQLWLLRWNQEIEACLDALPLLQEIIAKDPKTPADRVLRIEAKLLIGSLHRSRGKMEEFEKNLLEIEKGEEHSLLRLACHYSFERGIAAYLKEDYIAALEHFVMFRMHNLQDTDLTLSLMNELFCLENLGFPFDKTLKKLDEVLVRNEKNFWPPFPAIRSHRLCFEYRQNFKQGSFEFCERDLKAQETEKRGFDQARFFSIWTSLLPFHEYHSAESVYQVTHLMAEHPNLFQKGFRVRTLIENAHQVEHEKVRFTDLADRLYLWTWLWLSDPTVDRATMLLKTLDQVMNTFKNEHVSPMDYFMTKNAVSWIGLVCPAFEERFRVWIREISGQNIPVTLPLLEFEALIVDYLKQKIRGEDEFSGTLKMIESHSVFQNPSLNLKELLRQVDEPGIFSKWSKSILTSIQSIAEQEKTPAHSFCVIDPVRSLVIFKNGEQVFSESLVNAFKALKTNPVMAIPDFMKAVFGIQRFDEFIHQPKLFNLIARMKEALKRKITFRVRAGFIHTEGDWERVHIRAENLHSHSLKSSRQWQPVGEESSFLASQIEKTQSIPGSRKIEKIALSQFEKRFTRKELHEYLGGSKASMVRRLNELIESGSLVRQGLGKSTVYLLKKDGSK